MSRIAAVKIALMIGLSLQASAEVMADQIDGEELLDPTRPLFFSTAPEGEGSTAVMNMIRNVLPSSFEVSFIRASSTSPIAVVNSERVTIGDSIGGASVVAIDRSSVTLLVNGEEQRVSLYGNSVKSPATQ